MKYNQAKDFMLKIEARYGFTPSFLGASETGLVEVLDSFVPCFKVDSIRIGISKILINDDDLC